MRDGQGSATIQSGIRRDLIRRTSNSSQLRQQIQQRRLQRSDPTFQVVIERSLWVRSPSGDRRPRAASPAHGQLFNSCCAAPSSRSDETPTSLDRIAAQRRHRTDLVAAHRVRATTRSRPGEGAEQRAALSSTRRAVTGSAADRLPAKAARPRPRAGPASQRSGHGPSRSRSRRRRATTIGSVAGRSPELGCDDFTERPLHRLPVSRSIGESASRRSGPRAFRQLDRDELRHRDGDSKSIDFELVPQLHSS